MTKTQEYIDSVEGNAHQSDVEIIEKLEKELRESKSELDELVAAIRSSNSVLH